MAVTVAWKTPPGASVVTDQVTTLPVTAAAGEAVTYRSGGGSASVTTTPYAVSFPVLLTRIENTTGSALGAVAGALLSTSRQGISSVTCAGWLQTAGWASPAVLFPVANARAGPISAPDPHV